MQVVGADSDLAILDATGHLTPEVMVAPEELDHDIRGVIDRHVRACSTCAQQQASMAHAAQRIRRARPRVAVPADARIAARQAVLRGLVARRREQAARARQEPIAEEPRRIDPRPARIAWALVGLALLVAGAAALVAIFAR